MNSPSSYQKEIVLPGPSCCLRRGGAIAGCCSAIEGGCLLQCDIERSNIRHSTICPADAKSVRWSYDYRCILRWPLLQLHCPSSDVHRLFGTPQQDLSPITNEILGLEERNNALDNCRPDYKAVHSWQSGSNSDITSCLPKKQLSPTLYRHSNILCKLWMNINKFQQWSMWREFIVK